MVNALAASLSFDASVRAPKLEVVRVEGFEEIGRPYSFEVEAIGEGPTDFIDALLGCEVTLEILVTFASGSRSAARRVPALVESIQESMAPAANARHTYRFVLRPRFFELERFVAQDIYVGASVPAVLRTKLAMAELPADAYELRLADEAVYADQDGADADLAQGRLVVQYRESDLAFLSRLGEHVGISYFFDAESGSEQVVFTDYDQGFAQRSAPVPFGGDGDVPGLLELARRLTSVKSQFFTYDYNYRTPHLTYQKDGKILFDTLGGEAHLDVPTVGALLDYAPNVKTPKEAEFLASIRAEEEEAKRERYHCTSTDPTLFAGQRFRISGHPAVDEESELLCVSIRHAFSAPSSFQGPGSGEARYRGQLEAVRVGKVGPDRRVLSFRPERRTPKPRIHGVVTGVIQSAMAGQANGQQHIDAQGRYLLKLHFDQGPKTMPRVRMAQPSAGEGHGHHFPLRPGAEVVCAFLDGDPDRPVILGAVPNPTQRSPVTTPLEGTPPEVNRIKTSSGVVFEIGDGLPKGN